MQSNKPKKRSLSLIRAQLKYEVSDLAKERMNRYNQSEKGRERKRRWAAKKLAEKKAGGGVNQQAATDPLN